jgi:uncharacterized protein (DUF58 family)
VALLISIVGWYKTINLLVLTGFVLLALLIVNLRLAWQAAAGLVLRRRAVQSAFAHEVFSVSTDLHNDSSRSSTTLVYAESGMNRSAWMLSPLAAQDRRTLTARWSFPQRGHYPLGPIVLDSSYPLGLVHVVREHQDDAAVSILPELGRIDLVSFRHWLSRQKAGEGQSHRPSRRPSLGTGDVRGLRPFRPGDSLREVHWKTAARRGHLWVREYDRSDPIDLIFIIDPYLPDPVTVSNVTRPQDWERLRQDQAERTRRFEWVLSLTASLAVAFAESEHAPQLFLVVPTAEGLQQIQGRASAGWIREALPLLATLKGQSHPASLPTSALRPRASRAARLLLTPRDDCPWASTFRVEGISFATVSATRPHQWFEAPISLRQVIEEPATESPNLGHKAD